MNAPEAAFAAGVIDAARGDPGVTAAFGAPARIYAEPPSQPIYPYAVLGTGSSTPKEASGVDALEHVLTLHVWTRDGGRKATHDALHALRAALHDKSFPVAGRRVTFAFVTYADAFSDRNPRLSHGVMRLRAQTEPA